MNNPIVIYSNSSNGKFIIELGKTSIQCNIELFNSFGKLVFKEPIFHDSKKEIHLEYISAGIYFVKVKDGGKISRKKLIMQHN